MRAFLERHPVPGGLALLVTGLIIAVAVIAGPGDAVDDNSWSFYALALAGGVGGGLAVGGVRLLVLAYRDGRPTDVEM